MVFTKDYKALSKKNLYRIKGYEPQRHMKDFSGKR